eukprot:TRINITY_DN5933_c0_g1_i2.p1 TRINITY_DN5933_c0_g1~~TRINITY_DN5933_c0_g1_i2.p1  ORF type:complete len:2461 (-),score=532.25 TRINITY_DN5933_c0_g1_i2:137-6556(-)
MTDDEVDDEKNLEFETAKEQETAQSSNITSLLQSDSDAKPALAEAPMGKLTLLDDRTSPPLCCLCNSCSDKSICTTGEASTTTSSFISDETVLEKPPAQDSDASKRSPPREYHPNMASAGHTDEQRFRSLPGYGDNFHSTVLAQRTADDHERVWAQSRALIHTVEQEGIKVPAAYHFFDDDQRARCWRPAYQQGKCGSCWSFASLGALEKQICMRAGGTYVPSLSREMLVRCSEQNNACEGGNADKAYADLMEIGGVWNSDCLPYQGKGVKHCPAMSYSWFGQGSTGKTGKLARIDQEIMKSCKDLTRYSNRPPMGAEWDMPFTMMYEKRTQQKPNTSDPLLQRFKRGFAKSRGRDRIPSWWLYGQHAMQAAVVKYGSIYASYIAMNDFKKRQCKTGCWPPGTVWGEEAEFKPSDCGCPKNGHAVHIIGYGEDIQETGTRVPYWLIENSWGAEVHGDVAGEDVEGVKGWGKDPFTELHPMNAEDQCVLGGWYASTLPRTGGCGGNANVNIRKDIKITGGEADGFHFAVKIDDKVVLEKDVKKDSSGMFMTKLSMKPGNHSVQFMIYAKNHPKQQALHLEQYFLKAVSIRCRGRGYSYSFTKNDTKASVGWGRKTRKELKAAADALLTASGVAINQKFAKCPSACRTGRYSEVKPCEGLLTRWGSCYTQDWIKKHSWYNSRKKADCWDCTETKLAQAEQALATKALPSATFVKWHALVQQSFTAPDEPGWMRQFLGSCQLESKGHNKNTQMTATYQLSMPNGADGAGGCDERHSAPFVEGKFVNAPGPMKSGSTAKARCPMPLKGEVSLTCNAGVLKATAHTCEERASGGQLSPDVLELKQQCVTLKTKDACLKKKACAWDTLSGCDVQRRGYFKVVRGKNYHGIEDGAAFAIAEMSRFVSLCPTTGWSKWSTCSAAQPCASGMQSRVRKPAKGFTVGSPGCQGITFQETRPCVGPGFCSQVLTRFMKGGGTDLSQALKTYKAQSAKLPYSTAGAHIMESAYPSCTNATYWCNLITGKSPCSMIFSGNFQVKKTADYFFKYDASEGGGELEFNTLGQGEEAKPQYKIAAGGKMYAWVDTGFHHRRRRSGLKPWQPVSSISLGKGTYFARMTRTGWKSCPKFSLTLEQTTATYASPVLLGMAGNFKRNKLGGATQKKTTWNNLWGSMSSWTLKYRKRGYHGYAKAQEKGSVNEIVLRTESGGKVIAKKELTKLKYTADELYKLLGIDKTKPAAKFRKYWDYELVIRSTVVLPEKGEYKFRYHQDTSSDKTNQMWRSSSRRRYQRVMIRAGGKSVAAVKKWQPSSVLEVSHIANQAGMATFEVSVMLNTDGIDNRVALPNFFSAQLKREDVLHRGATGSIDFGGIVNHVSELDTLRGDDEVRIDWPDRDDPFSSELRTSTFKTIDHSEVLIGKSNLQGFMADAEGKVDAGACLSLEARVPGTTSGSFQGLALELCDKDGANQYLEMVSLSGVNASKRTRIGWVHVGFTQPTHLRLRRDPVNLTQFEVSYRPDNRLWYATPFSVHDIASAVGDYKGPLEVGVSMFSKETYRYAEFYNVSVEACPSTCAEAGKQVMCGEVRTACDTTLKCPTTCPSGGVCHSNMCMTCPALKTPGTGVGTASFEAPECGSEQQTCKDPAGRNVQVDRIIGQAAPTVNHVCIKGKWTCFGKKSWAYLAEGKQCGKMTNECGETVELFKCPLQNDVCDNYKCKCTPTAFDSSFNCGWQGDGCGLNTTFGKLGGACPGPTQKCNEHVCCTPKTLAEFGSAYECGSAPDGCGGSVTFRKAGIADAPFFTTKARRFYSTWMNNRKEHGTRFTVKKDCSITSLGRSVDPKTPSLSGMSTLTLWSEKTKKPVASVTVGPANKVSGGYASGPLDTYVDVKKGEAYRLTIGKVTSAYKVVKKGSEYINGGVFYRRKVSNQAACERRCQGYSYCRYFSYFTAGAKKGQCYLSWKSWRVTYSKDSKSTAVTLTKAQDKYSSDYRWRTRALASQYASWDGTVRSNKVGGYPSYGPYKNNGYGTVTFGIMENDGCGARSKCSQNKCGATSLVEEDPVQDFEDPETETEEQASARAASEEALAEDSEIAKQLEEDYLEKHGLSEEAAKAGEIPKDDEDDDTDDDDFEEDVVDEVPDEPEQKEIQEETQ